MLELRRHGLCQELSLRYWSASVVAAWPDGTLSSQYGFRYALFHEVLYSAVPVMRLVQLHRHIGLGLETSHGPETPTIAAELAMHFIHGRDPQRDVQYLRQAA